MTKVLLIAFLIVGWYTAGIFHSFALMLYAVCLFVFMLVMYIITKIYKHNISYDFALGFIKMQQNTDEKVKILIHNNSRLPVSKMRFYIEVDYISDDDVKGKKRTKRNKKYVLKKSIYGNSQRKNDSIEFSLNMSLCGLANISLKKVKMYDYAGIFYSTVKVNKNINAAIFPNIDNSYMNTEVSVSMSDMPELYIERAGDAIDDIRQIREYKSGDSYRHIHWNISSRTGELYVKEFSQEAENKVFIIPQVIREHLQDCEKMSAFYVKFAEVVNSLNNEKTVVNIMWYDYEFQAQKTFIIDTYNDFENVLYELYKYHQKCMKMLLPCSMEETQFYEFQGSFIVCVDSSLEVTVKNYLS